MPLNLVRNDITKMQVDAIVNAAKNSLLGGGGVDGAIHRAAGEGLFAECAAIGGCATGDAVITGGYNLPCKYVIHTVGPVWHGGFYGERQLLYSCYRRSLEIASQNGCKTLAFPLISSGAYGFPKKEALFVATEAITDFLNEHDNDLTVFLAVFDKASFVIGKELFDEIEQYIDDNYADEHARPEEELFRRAQAAAAAQRPDECCESRMLMRGFDEISECAVNETALLKSQKSRQKTTADNFEHGTELERLLSCVDESFSQMLLRKIDERNMTDAECYKKANIDRKLFSKIRSNIDYKPRKQTVIAFAAALELPLDELKEMLMKAGYALSQSSKFDIIVEYFFQKQNYNIFEINAALFAFDQTTLGA